MMNNPPTGPLLAIASPNAAAAAAAPVPAADPAATPGRRKRRYHDVPTAAAQPGDLLSREEIDGSASEGHHHATHGGGRGGNPRGKKARTGAKHERREFPCTLPLAGLESTFLARASGSATCRVGQNPEECRCLVTDSPAPVPPLPMRSPQAGRDPAGQVDRDRHLQGPLEGPKDHRREGGKPPSLLSLSLSLRRFTSTSVPWPLPELRPPL